MRVYKNLSEMIEETARELFSRGIRRFDQTRQGKKIDEPTVELIGYTYTVSDPSDYDEFFAISRKICQRDFHRRAIAERWFSEMIGLRGRRCENPQTFWMLHPELRDYFLKYCSEDGRESYTYCSRLKGQIEKVIEKLAENPERRGAVISVWRAWDLERVGDRRVPCSMFYQFITRQELDGRRVDVIYVQRSCDFINFFPFDVYRACRLAEYIAERLGWRQGRLIHFISSLHAFESEVPDRFKW